MNCRGSHSASRNLYFNYKSIATPVHPKVASSSTPASFAGNSKEKEKGMVRKNGRRGREGGKMSGSWHLPSLFYFTLLPFFLSLERLSQRCLWRRPIPQHVAGNLGGETVRAKLLVQGNQCDTAGPQTRHSVSSTPEHLTTNKSLLHGVRQSKGQNKWEKK